MAMMKYNRSATEINCIRAKLNLHSKSLTVNCTLLDFVNFDEICKSIKLRVAHGAFFRLYMYTQHNEFLLLFYHLCIRNNISEETLIRYEACMNLHTIIVRLICNLYTCGV